MTWEAAVCRTPIHLGEVIVPYKTRYKGGLVLCVLALVGDAGVDGRPLAVFLCLCLGSYHECLLVCSYLSKTKEPASCRERVCE